ncbi:MAG: molecular chaperone HtpG [Alphaproteobacteria bacterium]|nr:molecular chaperone HtpG [Alphaproteobacteria bacterium]
MTDQPTVETREFQAEVSRLLEIVAHSLYSERQVFLRELISNASDACDKLRFLAQQQADLTAGDSDFRIGLSFDKDARTLTVSDNGVGMDRDELVANLGTIARSGTAAFVKAMEEGQRKDNPLIGQFGVGFYSAFMVADRVVVDTRKAGTDAAWRWESDGKGSYAVSAGTREKRGTAITMHLKDDASEFLDDAKLGEIVRRYSDHIAIPIVLGDKTLNRASAPWTRPKAEVSEEQHEEFYRHVAHAFDKPWSTLHWRAEGKIEYAALLYVPGMRPMDLFAPERRHGVKLYVRRVFVNEAPEGLVPRYLRFLRGVVDSEDLPLNVSREMLQNNPVLTKIRQSVTGRVLGELEKRAKDDAAGYGEFWGNFGEVLKEGIFEDAEHGKRVLSLARFKSSAKGEEWVSLADYVARMKEGQDAIYYIAGDDAKAVASSPHIEGFRKRGIEVLLLSDPVDEFWIAQTDEFEGRKFRSVTRGAADLAKFAEGEKKDEAKTDAPDIAPLLALFRLALGESVKDVRASERLAESAVCLVADDNDIDIHLERMLRQHKQLKSMSRRILEVNPSHALVKALAETVRARGENQAVQARVSEIAKLLLDQARIVEGEKLDDPADFAKRMADALAAGFAPS